MGRGGRPLWRIAGASKSEMESLEMLRSCRLVFKLCVEESAQKAGSKTSIIVHVGVSLKPHFDVQHLRKWEVGGSDVTTRLVIDG